MKKIINYKGFQFEYLEINPFPEAEITNPILGFHGFGRMAEDFLIFEKLLKPGDVIYSFNLLQHGNSKAPSDRYWKAPFSILEFKNSLLFILDQLQIKAQFSLIGYSMGGRICMKIVEHFPQRIKSLTLIAPDGMKRSLGYLFVTRTWLGKLIFRQVIKTPNPIFFTAKWMVKMNLVSKSLEKITRYNLGTEDKRKQVGETWHIYSKLMVNKAVIQDIINEFKIPTQLIYGKYDRLMPPSQGERFVERLDDKNMLVLEMGHQLMVDEMVNKIKLFYSNKSM